MKKQIVITVTPSIELNKPPHFDVQVNGVSSPVELLAILHQVETGAIGEMQKAEAIARAHQQGQLGALGRG